MVKILINRALSMVLLFGTLIAPLNLPAQPFPAGSSISGPQPQTQPGSTSTLAGPASNSASVANAAEPDTLPPLFSAAGKSAVSGPAVSGPAGAGPVPADLVNKEEVTTARTESSATYHLGDGRYAVVQSTYPVHYQDAAGNWQPIVPSFAAVSGGWLNTANTLSTSLAERSSQARLGVGAVGVGWEPTGLHIVGKDSAQQASVAQPLPAAHTGRGQASQDASTVTYTQHWSSLDVQDQWQLGYGQAAYTLELAQHPKVSVSQPAWLDLRVLLHLSSGAALHINGQPVTLDTPLETSRPLEFVSVEGQRLLLDPPAIFERLHPEKKTPGVYRLAAGPTPDSVELRVRFAWTWLADPQRVYPVVIDPIFQTRSAIIARSTRYSYTGNFMANEELGALHVGTFGDGIFRSLLHFEMPTMPPGTVVDTAYLAAAPDDSSVYDEFYSDDVDAYALANHDWMSNANAAPQVSGGPLPVRSGNPMSWTSGSPLKIPQIWNVTSLAQSWHTNPASNHGILLRMKNECIFFFCGGFFFDYPSSFSDEEMRLTEDVSSRNQNILWTLGANSGIRLIVFYRGPNLEEGAPQTYAPPSANPKYYHPDHVYNLPPLPARWQAVVVRGLIPGDGEPNMIGNTPPMDVRPVQAGALAAQSAETPLEVPQPAGPAQAQDLSLFSPGQLPGIESKVYLGVFAEPYELSYVVLNGRSATGGAYAAHVQPLIGQRQPEQYEISLKSEDPTALVGQLDTATTIPVTLSTLETLRLWNVTLPTNANTRVDVFVSSSSDPDEYFGAYAFTAQLIRSDAGSVVPYTNRQSSHVFKGNDSFNYGEYGLESETFRANAASYGLVLANNTPYQPNYPGPGGMEVTYNINIRITACSPGSFPTGGGECQKVDCPDASFVAANFRTAGNLGLWSAAGWTSAVSPAQTVEGATAPLLGPASMSNAPTVAVVGGVVSYNGTVVNVLRETGAKYDPTVLLIGCTAGVTTFTDYVDVIHRTLQSAPRTGDGLTVLTSSFGGSDSFYDPWLKNDRTVLNTPQFFVSPIEGRAGETAGLPRNLGSNPAHWLSLNTSWSINASGPGSMLGSAQRLNGANPPPLAGLNVDLGSTFSLDLDIKQFKFVAARASQAFVTQPAQLGGASRAVQVLIFPWDAPLPTDPPRECDSTNCWDLRSPKDTIDKPDRVWSMPDIHLEGTPGLVAISANNALQVYSADFPNELRHTTQPAASQGGPLAEPVTQPTNFSLTNTPSKILAPASAQEFSGSFSYDTFGAKVVVAHKACFDGGPVVDVIEGATFITLPNIGDGADQGNSIASTFKLCQGELRQVHMAFHSSVGIPLGNSGLFLTGLSGTVDLYPAHTTINFGIDFQAAQGGDGGLIQMHGDVTIDTRGLFAFQGTGSVLKGFMGIKGSLWVGWSPLDVGFNVSVSYPRSNPWVTGMMRAHMWRGQGFANRYAWLPDNNEETHIAAQIGATLKIEEGAIFSWWWIDIPPDDINIEVEIAFGQFCTNDSCTSYEWGIKGRLTILGYDIGLYYSFGQNIDDPEISIGNLSFILGNDEHVLIDQYNGATDVPLQVAGGANRAMVWNSTAMNAPPMIYRSPNRIDAEDDLLPFTVNDSADSMLITAGWQSGSPQLSLLRPDGVEITPANAAAYDAQFETSLHSTLVGLRNPMPGAWQARLTNLSDDGREHYQFTYFANHSAPVKPGENIFLTPNQIDESAGSTYQITWAPPAGSPPNAKISLYATRVTGNITGTLETKVPIVQNLPLSAGAYNWDLTPLGSGTYQVTGIVDDGMNSTPANARSEDYCDPGYDPMPTLWSFHPERFAISTWFTATGTIMPNEPNLPPDPTGLVLIPQDGALLAQWDPSPDPTVVAYQVMVCHPWYGCRGTQTVVAPPTGQAPRLRLGALDNDLVSYTVYVSAQDVTGNSSLGSATASAMPSAAAPALPAAPVIITPTSSAGTTAVLNWQPGPGTPPTGYRVTYARLGHGGETFVAETTGTSLNLTGLAPGAVYLASVSARNAQGWPGAPSDPVRWIATSSIDADSDGLPDDWEARYGSLQAGDDNDRDGLTNLEEFNAGSDPKRQNSDADALSDAEEVAAGSDPVDSASFGGVMRQPRLAISDRSLVFRTRLQTPGELAMTDVITWTNTGGGTLNLAAQTSAPWLHADVQGDQVQIHVNPYLLIPGQFTGVIRLTPAPGSDPLIGPSACVRVQVWASPPDVGGFKYSLNFPLVNR